MKTTGEKQASPGSAVFPMLFGIVGALVISLLLLSAFSMVMAMRDIPTAAILALSYVSVAGGSFAGGLIASRMIRRRGLVVGAVNGLAFLVILYLAGLLTRQTQFNVDLVWKAAVVLMAGGAGGVIGMNGHRRRAGGK